MPRQRPPETSLPVVIGRLVRQRRLELKLEQDELATRSGLSKAVIRRYEFGDRSPSWEAMLRLARALELRPSEFVAVFEDWQPKPKRKKAAA